MRGMAEKNGVKFAPEKCQFMHFTCARKRHNLEATVSIRGHLTSPKSSLRVLGIYFDPHYHTSSSPFSYPGVPLG